MSMNWTVLAAALGAATAALAGCSQAQDGGSADALAPECAVQVSQAWVKAEDSGMTGAFGVLTNTGEQTAVVVGATSASAGMIELHEVVGSGPDARMQPKSGGFSVAPGEELVLQPGGLHIMLMGLTGPIQPGDEVRIALECDNGATADYTGLAKDFTGAQEQYSGGDESPGGHGGPMGDSGSPGDMAPQPQG